MANGERGSAVRWLVALMVLSGLACGPADGLTDEPVDGGTPTDAGSEDDDGWPFNGVPRPDGGMNSDYVPDERAAGGYYDYLAEKYLAHTPYCELTEARPEKHGEVEVLWRSAWPMRFRGRTDSLLGVHDGDVLVRASEWLYRADLKTGRWELGQGLFSSNLNNAATTLLPDGTLAYSNGALIYAGGDPPRVLGGIELGPAPRLIIGQLPGGEVAAFAGNSFLVADAAHNVRLRRTIDAYVAGFITVGDKVVAHTGYITEWNQLQAFGSDTGEFLWSVGGESFDLADVSGAGDLLVYRNERLGFRLLNLRAGTGEVRWRYAPDPVNQNHEVDFSVIRRTAPWGSSGAVVGEYHAETIEGERNRLFYEGIAALNDEGEMVWRFAPTGVEEGLRPRSKARVRDVASDAEGNVFVAVDDCKVYALDREGHLLWWHRFPHPPQEVLPLGGGRVLVRLRSDDSMVFSHAPGINDFLFVYLLQGGQ